MVLPIMAVLAGVGGLFPSFSLLANLYVLAVGGTLLWLGLRRRAPRRPSSVPGRGAAAWLAPALTLAAVELYTFTGGSTYHYPTLSLLLDGPLDSYPIRSAVYFGWLAGFWGLIRR